MRSASGGERTTIRNLAAAGAATALGFAIGAAVFRLGMGAPEGWEILAVFVAAPAAILALLPFLGRLAFFLLGLFLAFGVGLVMNLGGPDSPLLLIPLVGLGVAAGALAAEAAVRMVDLVYRLSRWDSPE